MAQITRRNFIKAASVVAASGALAACSGKGAAETALLPGTQTLSPAAPSSTPVSAPTAVSTLLPATADVPDLATLLLERLTFAGRPEERAAFLRSGLEDPVRLQAWLAEQLHPEQIDDSAFEARLKKAGFTTLDKSLEQLIDEHVVNNPYADNDDRHWQWFMAPYNEAKEAAFLRATYSKKQLSERLAAFWHNHFSVNAGDDDLSPTFPSYDRDVIRKHLFGNFRQMLEAVATHPLMLVYLNNRSNSDAGPNENYARELFELHTLGAENYLGVSDPNKVAKNTEGLAIGYVDNDVYEAARCFTGWRVDDDFYDYEDGVGKTGTFLYFRPWHDRFNKFILGNYLPADQPDMQDGRDVLDMLARHPGTATFISRKLCRRFICDDPPESIVQAAAQTFLANKDASDQLARVYTTIFTSAEFRSIWAGKVSQPFELAIKVLRALNADFTRLPDGLMWTYEKMGQPLYARHTPDGYPDKAAPWVNSMVTLFSWNFITNAAENWSNSEDDPTRVISVDLRAETPTALRTARTIVDYWIERIYGRQLPAASRQALIDFLRGDAGPEEALSDEQVEGRLRSTVELALMAPEFRQR